MPKAKTSLIFLLATMAGQAYAQSETSLSEAVLEGSTQPTNTNRNVERVEVTGSLIKRVDIEGPSAVQTLDKEYIQKSGWNNLGDLMRDLSVNSFGVNSDSAGSGIPSSQFANLRGLGADRTLVLIDGRIAPKDASVGAFDMSLIPMSAIERVDIMKDAGSALYGTDALGGVINIITKKDYNGSDFSMSHYMAQDKGGDRTTIGTTYGKSTSRGNFTTSFQIRNNTKIKSNDRDLTKIGDSFNSPAANYGYTSTADNDGDGNPDNTFTLQNNNESCANQPSSYIKNGFCRFRYNDIKDETPEIKQISNVTNFNYDINSTTNVFGTFLGSYKETDYVYAPGVVRLTLAGDSDTVTNLGLTDHDGVSDVNIYWRSTGLGNRITESKDVTLGGNAGARIYLGDTWEATFTAGHTNSLRHAKNPLGYSNASLIKDVIESDQFNVFTNTGVIPDSVRVQPFQRTESNMTTAEIRATGELADGWAGPIGLAVGAGYTYEDISITIDEQSAKNNVTGGGASNAGSGNRNSQFAVAEIAVPLTTKLDMQVATRFDHYQGFGNTVNPKMAFAFRPWTKMLLRASAGTGFKAPRMDDLYSGSEGYPTINDYQNGSNQYLTKYIPSPNLKPEKSKNISVGIVVEPVSNVSFNIDAYDNVINDAIVTPSLQAINDDEEALGVAATERKYGVKIDRESNGDPRYTVSKINMHEIKQRGLDFGAQARFNLGRAGTLSLRNDASYMFKYTTEVFAGDTIDDGLQSRGAPKWKNRGTVAYAPKDWLTFDTSLATTGSHFKENEEDGKFNMYTRIDAAVTLGLFKNTAALRLGVQDLTGEKPPYDLNANNVTVNSLYDYTGRRFFASYRQSF